MRWPKDWGTRTAVMGVINLTPDSFSDGGQFYDHNKAINHAKALINQGADIIDIGGESTRPGSSQISLDEEIKRVIPVIEKVRFYDPNILISIDSTKSEVAKRAIEVGADIVNDISSFSADKEMPKIVSDYKTPVILMHMQGNPINMQIDPRYDDIINDIKAFFQRKIEISINFGIKKESIILDPGIGFGKTVADNFMLISKLRKFCELGFPILVGPSRKSFIGEVLDLPVHDRLEGTLSSIVVSIMNGAKIVRVHDVKEVKRVVKISEIFKDAE